jgi:peptide methionine sulfoxide reductase MsrA
MVRTRNYVANDDQKNRAQKTKKNQKKEKKEVTWPKNQKKTAPAVIQFADAHKVYLLWNSKMASRLHCPQSL